MLARLLARSTYELQAVGLRYPHLERNPAAADRLAAILAARSQ
jgi:hypothetical protein